MLLLRRSLGSIWPRATTTSHVGRVHALLLVHLLMILVLMSLLCGVLHSVTVDALLHLLPFPLTSIDGTDEAATLLLMLLASAGAHVDQWATCHARNLFLLPGRQIPSLARASLVQSVVGTPRTGSREEIDRAPAALMMAEHFLRVGTAH